MYGFRTRKSRRTISTTRNKFGVKTILPWEAAWGRLHHGMDEEQGAEFYGSKHVFIGDERDFQGVPRR